MRELSRAMRNSKPRIPRQTRIQRTLNSVDEDTVGCGCTCGALLLYGAGLLVFWSLVGYGIYTFIIYLQSH